jgi:hypothetical protein
MRVLVGCDKDSATPLPQCVACCAWPLYSLCESDYQEFTNLHPSKKHCQNFMEPCDQLWVVGLVVEAVITTDGSNFLKKQGSNENLIEGYLWISPSNMDP